MTSLETGAVERAQQLYERGKRYEWTAEELPWQLGTKLQAKQRRQGARVLSQVLHGEQASYDVIELLLAQVTEPAARQFLEAQAADEARHIAVFTRYINILDEVQPVGENLGQMFGELLTLPTIEEKMVGMHVLVEGMALELFHALVAEIDDPLLGQLLRRVFPDESRHVAFGLSYLRQAVRGMDAATLERALQVGGRYAALATGMIREERQVAAGFGIDLGRVQARTIRVLFRRLQQIGLLDTLQLF